MKNERDDRLMCMAGGRPGRDIFFSAGEKRFFEQIEPKKKIESKNIYSSEPKFYQELKSALKSTF